MKKAVFAVLLAASLAVNAVLLYQKVSDKKKVYKSWESRVVKNDIKIKFTKEQREQIREILHRSREIFSENRMKILELKMKIVDEIAAPSEDPADISEMVKELNSLEGYINVDFVNTLISISEVLEFDQRVAFLTRFSKAWFHKHYERKRRRMRDVKKAD